jgi:hypothetical protein
VDASDIYLAKAAPERIQQQLKRPINATIGTLNADGSIHLALCSSSGKAASSTSRPLP